MNRGSSTRLPYSTKPSIVIRNRPTEKLRYFKSEKRTMGCSTTNSRIMKAVNRTAAVTARVMIRSELNQSSCWPLSSMTWSAPMPTASMPNPIRSTFSLPRRT